MKKSILLAFLIAATSLAAHAQTAVYAEYGASWYGLPSISIQTGPTFGVYYDHWGIPFVRTGFDARASFIGSGSEAEDTGLIGPRIQIHPHILPLMPYGEALIGVAHLDVGKGILHTQGNHFAYALNAGLDLTVFPRLDWRVLDYTWGGIPGTILDSNPSTLSTGLVLRLP